MHTKQNKLGSSERINRQREDEQKNRLQVATIDEGGIILGLGQNVRKQHQETLTRFLEKQFASFSIETLNKICTLPEIEG